MSNPNHGFWKCVRLSLVVGAMNLTATSVLEAQSNIRIEQLDGRSWLIGPEGIPFFAHGVTHVGGEKLKVDPAAISKAIVDLGFNAYGYGSTPKVRNGLPYVDGRNFVPISTYRGDGSFQFPDIFDPAEQRRLAGMVQQTCRQNRDNTNLIGYCWTDLAAWPLKNTAGQNWVAFIRSLPDSAPGKQAYLKFVGTHQGGGANSDAGFLKVIAREYFRVMGEANRKYDPDHLIFGDRFAFNTIVPDVVTEMLPWVDAIAVQPPFRPGFPREEFDRIHRLTGKPILICDVAVRFKDGDKAVRGWKPVKDAATAGRDYAEYVRAARETPYVLGVFWCNPIDSRPGFNKSGIKQGLFGEGFVERPELNQSIRELNRFLIEATPTAKVPRQVTRPGLP